MKRVPWQQVLCLGPLLMEPCVLMVTDNFAYLIIEGHYALMRFADVNLALAAQMTAEGHT